MKSPVEAFYDRFSRTFVRDYVLGNRRVERQIAFFRAALPPSARRVLVIGCGSGESALAIAHARDAQVLAVDLSDENLRIARALHADPRITYERRDVTVDPLPGPFDAILLPDVYEHIPLDGRAGLHATMSAALAPRGRILLTVPSPGKQASLAGTDGMQIVDEVVSMDDLVTLARDVAGHLVYFNLISVWEANDYVHAVVARGHAAVASISDDDRVPIAGWDDGVLARLGEVRPVRLATRGARALVRLARLRHLIGRKPGDGA